MLVNATAKQHYVPLQQTPRVPDGTSRHSDPTVQYYLNMPETMRCMLSFFLFSLSLVYLSLRFNSHFPGEPGLAGVY